MDPHRDYVTVDWETVLELDEALAGWCLQGPARGEWGWEWGWAASDLQDPDWDTEDLPAVSDPPPPPTLSGWKKAHEPQGGGRICGG